MKYSSSSSLFTPLISVLYFSWLKGRKTSWAAEAALPLSPYQLTSNGNAMLCCVQKVCLFSSGKEALQQGVCNWCSLCLSSWTCSRLLLSQYFSAVSAQFLTVVCNQSRGSDLQSLCWVPQSPGLNTLGCCVCHLNMHLLSLCIPSVCSTLILFLPALALFRPLALSFLFSNSLNYLQKD